MTRGRVCIVTPGYISSTPRVVREANALSAAGLDVRVVFTQGQLEQVRAFDAETLRNVPWQWEAFGWSDTRQSERRAFHLTRFRHKGAGLLARALPAGPIVSRAEGRTYPELTKLATAKPADLFIGHYPVGLAAAANAARKHGSRLGFDVEDLYADTHTPTTESLRARRRVLSIERRYVPGCSHISAVSAPVRKAFSDRYGCAAPVLMHNCCEWAERALLDGGRRDRSAAGGVSMYWFSQTIGLNRGLQDAIRALASVPESLHLHLRGAVTDDVARALIGLARESGVESRVHLHGSEPPRSMLSRAAEHEIGLALEPGDTPNNRLTVSNKLFTYLMAGCAVVASDTEGQRSVMTTCADAGVLYQPGDVRALATHLNAWLARPDLLARARASALEAARLRWNAEVESRALVNAVLRVLDQPSRGDTR